MTGGFENWLELVTGIVGVIVGWLARHFGVGKRGQ